MSTRPSMPATGIAISAAAIAATIILLTPLGASAAPPVSQGEGRFLTATLGGAPITSIANLAGASAVDATGNGTVTSDTPLNATVLNSINLTTPGINLLAGNGIVQLGAVGQYAQARDDGSSDAFSGAVSAFNSLVGAGTVTPGPVYGTPSGTDTADIALGNPTTSPLSANITIGALAASAHEAADGTQTGQYTLAGLNAVVGGTTLSPVLGTVSTALGSLVTQVNTAAGTTIADPISGGTITLSLADLLAQAGVPDVNALPPGTDLLQYIPAAVVAKVNTLLTSLSNAVNGLAAGPTKTTLTTALAAATPTINTALTGLAPTLAPLVAALATLKVNNQTHNADGSFTENAATLGLLAAAGGVATVSLANATVGPNAPLVTTSGTTPGGASAPTLAQTGMVLPVGGMLAAAGGLAAAGVALAGLAAHRRRGTHRVSR